MNLTIEACKYCFIASCKDLPFFKAVVLPFIWIWVWGFLQWIYGVCIACISVEAFGNWSCIDVKLLAFPRGGISFHCINKIHFDKQGQIISYLLKYSKCDLMVKWLFDKCVTYLFILIQIIERWLWKRNPQWHRSLGGSHDPPTSPRESGNFLSMYDK